MSKFLERWEEENKKFVLPQGTDDLKKLRAVVESLLVEKLVDLVDSEFKAIKETLGAILQKLVEFDAALKGKSDKITIPSGTVK